MHGMLARNSKDEGLIPHDFVHFT